MTLMSKGLILKNVNKVYNVGEPREYVALKNVNLELSNSGLTLIVGESGSGKSTMLNIIAGLDNITSGEIINPYGEGYASFVFQDSELVNDFTVIDNLKSIIRIALVEDKALYYLEKFGLLKYKNHKANELSGGQRQRLSIIRALLLNKPMLLCDEPTGALDKRNSKEIADILKEESKERLVIVVSHDKDLFYDLADRVISISDGEIVDDTIKNENNIETNYSIQKANLRLREASKYSTLNIKNSPIRYALTMISLMISLLIILTGFNVFFTDEAKSRCRIYDEYSICYTYALDLVDYEAGNKIGLSFEEYSRVKNKYDEALMFADHNIDDAIGCNNTRLVITDECEYPIENGTNNLSKDDIIISDVMAYDIMVKHNIAYNDVIGFINNSFFGYKIIGVYDTGFDAINPPYSYNPGGYYDEYHRTAFLNTDTFKDYIELITDGLELELSNDVIIKLKIDNSLKDNEAIVGSNLSIGLGNNTIKYLNSYFYQKSRENEQLSNKDFSSLNINVLQTSEDSGLFISKELYNELFESLAYYKECDGSIGVGFTSYNTKRISYLLDMGLEFDSYIDEDIYYVKSFLTKAGIIEITIGLLLLVVTVVLINNYIFNNLVKNKKIIGILSSIWVKKKQLWKIFFLDVALLSFIAFISSSVLLAGIINVQNDFVANYYETSIDYLYYSFIPVAIVLLFVIFTIFISMFLAYRSISKKTIIDLVYER